MRDPERNVAARSADCMAGRDVARCLRSRLRMAEEHDCRRPERWEDVRAPDEHRDGADEQHCRKAPQRGTECRATQTLTHYRRSSRMAGESTAASAIAR